MAACVLAFVLVLGNRNDGHRYAEVIRHEENTGSMELTDADGDKYEVKGNSVSFMKALPSSADYMMMAMKTPRGECADVTLADGTRVWLNGESVLEFPNRFIGARRKVRLSCEAYFDVAKDSRHPFIVTTNYYSVSVLGTSFSACAYSPSDAALVLAEGRVRMSSAAHVGSLVLTPGACNGYIVSSVGPIAQPTILCEYASVINDM